MKNVLVVTLCLMGYQDFPYIFQLRENSGAAWEVWQSIKGQVGRRLVDFA